MCALLLFVPFGGWLLTLLAPLTLWPSFAPAIRADRDGAAFRAAVIWAVLLSIGVLAFTWFAPAIAGERIVRGESYRAEMFHWIESGVGKEGDWHRFLPEHALHLAAFAILAAASGGYFGLALGAALLAYMNFFVASLMRAGADPWYVLANAWFPWSIARVLAFIALGVVLARPLLRRRPFEPRHLRWLVLILLGLALDVGLKTALAESFRGRLAVQLGKGRAAASLTAPPVAP